MSKTERLTLIQSIAGRVNRVLARLVEANTPPAQARRVLRRTCPKLKLAA